jgi:hypothetical protein
MDDILCRECLVVARLLESCRWYHPEVAAAARLHDYSFKDYLRVEETSRIKHEFLAG